MKEFALKTVLFIVLLVLIQSVPSFAQRNQRYERLDQRGVTVWLGFPQGEKLTVTSPDFDGPISLEQKNGFVFGASYDLIRSHFAAGFFVMNHRQPSPNYDLNSTYYLTASETKFGFTGDLRTRWSERDPLFDELRYQFLVGGLLDITGKTISIENGNNEPVEIGNFHEHNIYFAMRVGMGNARSGLGYLEMRLCRKIFTSSMDVGYENWNVEPKRLTRIWFLAGIYIQ